LPGAERHQPAAEIYSPKVQRRSSLKQCAFLAIGIAH
jgi:hypothetical protein